MKFTIELIIGAIFAVIVLTGRIVTGMTGKETYGSSVHKRHQRRRRNKTTILLIAIILFGLGTLLKLVLNIPN